MTNGILEVNLPGYSLDIEASSCIASLLTQSSHCDYLVNMDPEAYGRAVKLVQDYHGRPSIHGFDCKIQF
jgi:hypothetical protein